MSNKTVDLHIKNYSVKDRVIEIHKNLPLIPFNLCVYGRSNCGKTNMLVNLLKHYKKHFKRRLIIFTKSRSGTLYVLKDKLDAEIFHSLNDDDGSNIIENIIEGQNNRKENGEKLEHICILLDDFITDNSFDKKRNIYDKLFSMARHCLISVIITSQQYTLIPSNLRRMSWNDIIYKISNQTEKKLMIYEECSSLDMTEQEFENIYHECVKEKFNFMFIDKIKEKWQQNFGV